ncbi:hypothetical protein K491DRAFT_135716 [Lophiostoma macrostomum CBS 122681]|uniref:Uncharacterized protein n=1 Tax=Lophiostoma macrostomum CBS 122681 TaxID=1314788 RepID=A0A6A6TIG4_9PLEO|nr:hypothetical protein K491DRAFT_135716 [Lophiostoma macrostomum CBS 122681]
MSGGLCRRDWSALLGRRMGPDACQPRCERSRQQQLLKSVGEFTRAIRKSRQARTEVAASYSVHTASGPAQDELLASSRGAQRRLAAAAPGRCNWRDKSWGERRARSDQRSPRHLSLPRKHAGRRAGSTRDNRWGARVVTMADESKGQAWSSSCSFTRARPCCKQIPQAGTRNPSNQVARVMTRRTNALLAQQLSGGGGREPARTWAGLERLLLDASCGMQHQGRSAVQLQTLLTPVCTLRRQLQQRAPVWQGSWPQPPGCLRVATDLSLFAAVPLQPARHVPEPAALVWCCRL